MRGPDCCLIGQREFLRALQHVRARGAEHNNGTRAFILLRTVVVTPGAGEIVYAVLVDVTAEREIMLETTLPSRKKYVHACLQLEGLE